MASPQYGAVRVKRVQQSPHTNQPHPLAGLATLPVELGTRRDRTIPRVEYSRTWLMLSGLLAGAGLAASIRFGRPVFASLAAAGLAVLGYIGLVEPRSPRFEQIELKLNTLPAGLDGLRIGQLSDLHLGQPFSEQNARWAIEQMQRDQPDLIVITGDFTSKPKAVAKVAPLLASLRAPLGIYAITGNHDYWDNLVLLRNTLADLGIPLMFNEHRRLEWNGTEFYLLGLDDMWDGTPDLLVANTGVPQGVFRLLLEHSPDFADEAAAAGIDMQLSGHTHGGHIRWPGLGAAVLPRHGIKYDKGLFKVGEMQLYVSRGLGGGPFRLFSPPEATLITLRRGA